MSAFGGKADKCEHCGISPLHVGTVTGSTHATAAATALFRPCPHKSRQRNARNDGARDHQNRREINVHRLIPLRARVAQGWALFAILVRTPDEVQLTNIVSFPCEHFSVAQDTLSGPRFPGGTFGFDHLVDGAALARDSEVGHGANTRSAAPLPYHYRHDQLSRTSPARCCQGAVRVLSGCCQARLRIRDVAS